MIISYFLYFFYFLFFITICFLVGRFFFLKEKINDENVAELAIFGLGTLVLVINFFYFFLRLNLLSICIIFMCLAMASFFLSFKNYLIVNLKFIYSLFLFSIFIFSLPMFYGEQFYVFRGNIWDHFSYLSTGLIFANYNFKDVLDIYDQIIGQKNLNFEPYIQNGIRQIHYRPSAQLLIGSLFYFPKIDIFISAFLFKSIVSIFSLLSFYSFIFPFLRTNLKLICICSISYVMSFFYFYNYEIDALALLLFTPFSILIIKRTCLIDDHIKNRNHKEIFKYFFLCSLAFIIYPEGASLFFVPIFLYFIFFLRKTLFTKLTNFIYFSKFFLISVFMVLPLYESTINYLFFYELSAGFSRVPFWGYYGAFVLGKSNPIHSPEVVENIKNLLLYKTQFFDLLNIVINYNIKSGNNFFYLNILPSAFGFFHFSTHSDYELYNYLFFFILVFLNFFIIINLYRNLNILFQKKSKFFNLLKCFIFFFLLFFFILIYNQLFWSAIKLYLIFGVIFYILVSFTFLRNSFLIKPNLIFIILLTILPIYKYSIFNNGIGRLDSFPSIININQKKETKWEINENLLKKCKKLSITSNNNQNQKVYISLKFNQVRNKSYETQYLNNCSINFINDKFIIEN